MLQRRDEGEGYMKWYNFLWWTIEFVLFLLCYPFIWLWGKIVGTDDID